MRLNPMRATLGRRLVLAVVGLVVVVLVLQSSGPYRSTQWTELAFLAIAAGGLTVLTGLSGQISLGHGALMAVGAYATAVLLEEGVTSITLLLVLSALAALLVGGVAGAAAARLSGPYLAGATLALAIAVPGVALSIDRLGGATGMSIFMPDIPVWVADLAWFVTGQELNRSRYLAYIAWITLIVVYVLLANLMRSRVGRRWAAIRDDDVAAELAGINLARSRISAFAVSAACAGVAGCLLAFAVRLAAPTSFTLVLSLTLLSAVVLGGLGSLSGALLGSALLTFLPPLATDFGIARGLSDVKAAELAPLLYGVTMVLVIIFAPSGLVGVLRRAWEATGQKWLPTSQDRPASRDRSASQDRPTRPDPPDRINQIRSTEKGTP